MSLSTQSHVFPCCRLLTEKHRCAIGARLRSDEGFCQPLYGECISNLELIVISASYVTLSKAGTVGRNPLQYRRPFSIVDTRTRPHQREGAGVELSATRAKPPRGAGSLVKLEPAPFRDGADN